MKLNLSLEQKEDVRNVFKEYYRCFEAVNKFRYEREDKTDLSPTEENQLKNQIISKYIKNIRILSTDLEVSLTDKKILSEISSYFENITEHLVILIKENVEDISEDDIMNTLFEITEVKNDILDEI